MLVVQSTQLHISYHMAERRYLQSEKQCAHTVLKTPFTFGLVAAISASELRHRRYW